MRLLLALAAPALVRLLLALAALALVACASLDAGRIVVVSVVARAERGRPARPDASGASRGAAIGVVASLTRPSSRLPPAPEPPSPPEPPRAHPPCASRAICAYEALAAREALTRALARERR